jgi:hypothetical protein
VPVLEAAGLRLRCVARRPAALASRVSPTTEVVAGDLLHRASLDHALAGVDVAYYLVHSIVSGRKPSDCDSVPTYPDPPFADTSTAQFAAQCVRAASHGLADVNGQNLATEERLPFGQRWQSALSTST